MEVVRATSIAALFLLCVTIAPTGAQQDRQTEERGKPDQQHDRQVEQGQPRGRGRQQQIPSRAQQPQQQRQGQQRGQAQPAQQQRREQQQRQADQPQQQRREQQQAQRGRQARQQEQPQRTQRQAVAWQQQRGWLKQGGGWQEHSTFQQNRAQRWDTDHRTWLQRGGYGGYYIPQSTFSISFGRQHWFRMRSQPTMYMGYPRFYYGGFSFLLLDPWPEYWADNWYATDDVYIDYDDGYYLYNRRSPDVRLAITVVM